MTFFSQKGHDTLLSHSHAGDKGDSTRENVGQRPVDAAVLPRPSVTIPLSGMCNRHMPICKEEGKAAVSVPSKQQGHFAIGIGLISSKPKSAQVGSSRLCNPTKAGFAAADWAHSHDPFTKAVPKSAKADWAQSQQRLGNRKTERIGRGKLYFRLIVAAALLLAAFYSFAAFAGNNLKRMEAYLHERVV